MATKPKPYAFHGPHSAGIYADLSIDGPEIGTLVAIVDRARNLPNRKTIGKQDPYCAARLGKEAKKTATDVRGGQTPRWDQELRFKVHDSPDYYQLKISVFTDDKRTDLIGEAWIDLKAIIVPGGGQNDLWQTLTCRGKYAGELRIEITFYDTRPKPEKPAPKAIPQHAAHEVDNGSLKSRGPAKRRPLPSDPVTGEVPVPQPSAAPPAPAPAPAPAAASSPMQDPYQTPPRPHARHNSHAGFVPNHSPLQSIEHHTPPSSSRYPPQDYATPSPGHYRGEVPHRPAPRQTDSFDSPSRQHDDRDYASRPPPPSSYYAPEPRGHPPPDHYDQPPPRDDPRQFPPVDERPPPPPAHRSSLGGGYDSHAQKPPAAMPMRHDVLKNEAQRHSMSAYPASRSPHGAYDSAPPEPMNAAPMHTSPGYDQSIPRHRSYDAGYDSHPRHMQATVEDAPDSPTGPYGDSYRHGPPRAPHPADAGYDRGSYPPPPQMSRSPGASPLRHSPSPRDIPEEYDYSTSPSQRGYGYQHGGNPAPYTQAAPHYDAPPAQRPAAQGMPDLPPSLVPGVDPALSQELADQINHERRFERRYTTQNVGTPPRGRPPADVSYGPGESGSPYGYGTPPQQQTPDRRGGPDALADRRPAHSHGGSPQPPGGSQHMIKRKSVSPAPSPVEERRSTEVPFGPDSFDAFNSSMASREDRAPVDPNSKIVMHDGREVDPSDHLPVESWAPEPEPKPQKQPSPEPRARPSPNGAQPMPPSGRRQLRVAAARPSTAPGPAAAAPRPSYGPQDPHTPPAPGSGGRNRLHKKQRPPAGPASPHGPAESSPLAPISPGSYQERQHGTPTRGGARHYDYPSENYSPHGPPIPAKEPMPQYVMSGANGGGEASLAHEMQRIDIGSGPSRRRGGY